MEVFHIFNIFGELDVGVNFVFVNGSKSVVIINATMYKLLILLGSNHLLC